MWTITPEQAIETHEEERIQHLLDKYSIIGNFTTPSYNGAPNIEDPIKMITIRTTDKKKLFIPFILKYDMPICVCQVHDPYETKITVYGRTEQIRLIEDWLSLHWRDNIILVAYFGLLDNPDTACLKFKILDCSMKDSNKFRYYKNYN